MSLIRFHDVSKSYDSQPVLREVFFRVEQGDRIGLIGKNGTGKTTLIKLILGQEELGGGTIEIADGVRLGYFSQFSALRGEASVLEVLDEVFADIQAVDAELTRIDGDLADAQDAQLDGLLARQADLLEQMERRDGWTYTNRIETVLSKLKFSDADQLRPVDQLSGGWRNRAALARILLEDPDVLLMDEPTNFLDVEGLQWLETWFGSFRGALIVVSHDRSFLDNVVTRIVEIENYHLHEYPGNFAEYVREKRQRMKRLEHQFRHEEELLAFEAEAITDRREAARDPSRALKRKLASIKKRAEPRPVDRIVTSMYQGLHVAQKLCAVSGISKAYDDQVLFESLSFEIQRGDRLAVLGPNGCGKSTLLRVLVEHEEVDSGKVAWVRGGDIAYFNAILDSLDVDDTVTHSVNLVGMAFNTARKTVHQFLALLQFSELDLKKRIGTLSGGQRARVALAHCLLSGASTIVLDEPTNHLDLTSTQVMERALVNFPGAVVVVSHDRFFVDKVATRMLVNDGSGGWAEFNGNWTMWRALHNERQPA